jgi:hypothetical protein
MECQFTWGGSADVAIPTRCQHPMEANEIINSSVAIRWAKKTEPLCHQVPSLHWGLELRDGRHQRNDLAFCRATGGFPELYECEWRVLLSGAGVCPPRAVAITSPPFLPPRLARGRSSSPGFAPVRPEALVCAAGLAQQSGNPANWTESVT